MLKRMAFMTMAGRGGGVIFVNGRLVGKVKDAGNRESRYGLNVGLLKATL
jgi:hypothetical protein